MLVLTENATTAISALTDQRNMGDTGGIRIATTQHEGTEALTLDTAPEPEEGDQIIEQEGARVFLEPGAAAALGDKVLDAQVDDAGRVQFLVATQ